MRKTRDLLCHGLSAQMMIITTDKLYRKRCETPSPLPAV